MPPIFTFFFQPRYWLVSTSFPRIHEPYKVPCLVSLTSCTHLNVRTCTHNLFQPSRLIFRARTGLERQERQRKIGGGALYSSALPGEQRRGSRERPHTRLEKNAVSVRMSRHGGWRREMLQGQASGPPLCLADGNFATTPCANPKSILLPSPITLKRARFPLPPSPSTPRPPTNTPLHPPKREVAFEVSGARAVTALTASVVARASSTDQKATCHRPRLPAGPW